MTYSVMCQLSLCYCGVTTLVCTGASLFLGNYWRSSSVFFLIHAPIVLPVVTCFIKRIIFEWEVTLHHAGLSVPTHRQTYRQVSTNRVKTWSDIYSATLMLLYGTDRSHVSTTPWVTRHSKSYTSQHDYLRHYDTISRLIPHLDHDTLVLVRHDRGDCFLQCSDILYVSLVSFLPPPLLSFSYYF